MWFPIEVDLAVAKSFRVCHDEATAKFQGFAIAAGASSIPNPKAPLPVCRIRREQL